MTAFSRWRLRRKHEAYPLDSGYPWEGRIKTLVLTGPGIPGGMTGTVAAVVWGDVPAAPGWPRAQGGRPRPAPLPAPYPAVGPPSGVPSERMATIPDGARRFLATGPLAHVITLDPEGSPHVSLAWAGFEGDQVVFSSFFDQRKLANLRRDPRVTLSFQANENVDKEFLHPYLV